MSHKLDLTGQQLGRLTVVREDLPTRARSTWWVCACECGRTVVLSRSSLRDKRTKSCGCLQRDRTAERNRANATHGHTAGGRRSPTFQSWSAMRARCCLQTHRHFADYGGRGIGVCERWESFENFLADMGERPEGKTLDRIDNDRGYEPGNCRWATWVEQHNNQRNNHLLTVNGETLTIAQWTARLPGATENTIRQRLRGGWPVDRAVLEPVHRRARRFRGVRLKVDQPRVLRWAARLARRHLGNFATEEEAARAYDAAARAAYGAAARLNFPDAAA